jgi:hypothetical protein
VATARVKFYELCPSPLGDLLLVADGKHLTGLHFIDQKYLPSRDGDWHHEPALPVLIETRRQLDEYFAGARQCFELPLAPIGTAFSSVSGTRCSGYPTVRRRPTAKSRSAWTARSPRARLAQRTAAIQSASSCPAIV